MKIYTKTGDHGETSLLGGSRVPKYHLRIEAYGTVDELNAHVGLVRDQKVPNDITGELLAIQDRLFTIGSQLAKEPGNEKIKIPHVAEADIKHLEEAIDRLSEELPPMRSFILPGGHLSISHCHLARCVCRRAERNVVHLANEVPIPEVIPKYLNRLSDYLFILSRYLGKWLQVKETPWEADK